MSGSVKGRFTGRFDSIAAWPRSGGPRVESVFGQADSPQVRKGSTVQVSPVIARANMFSQPASWRDRNTFQVSMSSDRSAPSRWDSYLNG